jgi:nucleotide-binding universal stress UspA family protein
LKWAARIAGPIGARLHLVQAVPLLAVPSLADPDAVARAIRSKMAKALKSCELAASKLRARGLQVTTSTHSWLSAETMINAASELEADLIVLGRRRGRSLTRVFGGSISSQVVRLARTDVMVAIGPPPKAPVLRVLVGIDGSGNGVRALRSARRIFPFAEISAMFAVQTGDRAAARSTLMKAATAAGLQADEVALIVRKGGVVKEIVGEVTDGGHHVLVVGRRGMGPFKRLLVGSICDKLLQLSPTSMLVVK